MSLVGSRLFQPRPELSLSPKTQAKEERLAQKLLNFGWDKKPGHVSEVAEYVLEEGDALVHVHAWLEKTVTKRRNAVRKMERVESVALMAHTASLWDTPIAHMVVTSFGFGKGYSVEYSDPLTTEAARLEAMRNIEQTINFVEATTKAAEESRFARLALQTSRR